MEESRNCSALKRLVSRYPILNEDQSIIVLLSQVNLILPLRCCDDDDDDDMPEEVNSSNRKIEWGIFRFLI
jgi:hypothetical protein